jgi:hypothetical protein
MLLTFALPSCAHRSLLSAQLNDQSLPLFDRYQAMFSLRNNGGKTAVLALTTAFGDPSPLFRHEVAFVLGQLQVRVRRRLNGGQPCGAACGPGAAGAALSRHVNGSFVARPPRGPPCVVVPAFSAPSAARPQHPASVEALKQRIDDPAEHEMVRHEAAGASSASAAVVAAALARSDERVGCTRRTDPWLHPAFFPLASLFLLRCTEALGAIGTGECVEYLTTYAGPDKPLMLRESCQVALDVVDYWTAGDAAEKEKEAADAAAPDAAVA